MLTNSTAANHRAKAEWPSHRWKSNLWYIVLGAGLVAMIVVSFARPIDRSGESQLDDAFTRALIGFGIARTLNGVISVAQGTEFAVQPAGIGVNFSPGEILDPVNDLVERFSWVMLAASTSLGIQQILLKASSWEGISYLFAGAAVFWFLIRLQSGGAAGRLATIASRILLAMVLIRFLIPVGALANDWVFQQFLQPKYEESSEQLASASERIREIAARSREQPEEAESIGQKIKMAYNSVTSKFDLTGMLDDYKAAAENVSEHAINMIVVFTLQTIIFPLLFLFIVYRLFCAVILLPPQPTHR